ncbi:MAG: hypothetical protein JWR09_3449 [Mucilaginibacter sp.]|nr:hypothetical protein [Mucilaginibacter sp.]
MTLTKVTLIIIFLFVIQIASAQTFLGFDAGVSNNVLNTNITNRASTVINSKSGYLVELLYEHRMSRLFYIKISPNIIQKNYTIKRTDSLSGVFTQYNNTYLQLPFKLGVNYGQQLQIFSEFGCYLGYWLSGNVNGDVPDIFSVTNNNNQQTFSLSSFNQGYSFNIIRDNRFEFGWVANAGLKYKVSTRYTIFINGCYYQSLSDQQKKYMINQVPQYNQTFTFSSGCMYLLKL